MMNCMDDLCAPIVLTFKAKAGMHKQCTIGYLSQLQAGMYDIYVPIVLLVTARGWYV